MLYLSWDGYEMLRDFLVSAEDVREVESGFDNPIATYPTSSTIIQVMRATTLDWPDGSNFDFLLAVGVESRLHHARQMEALARHDEERRRIVYGRLLDRGRVRPGMESAWAEEMREDNRIYRKIAREYALFTGPMRTISVPGSTTFARLLATVR